MSGAGNLNTQSVFQTGPTIQTKKNGKLKQAIPRKKESNSQLWLISPERKLHFPMRIIPGYINNQKNGQPWTKKGDLPSVMKLANEHHHCKVARNVHVTRRCLYVVLRSKQRTLRSQAGYLTLCALFSPIYKMGIIIKIPNSYVVMETK